MVTIDNKPTRDFWTNITSLEVWAHSRLIQCWFSPYKGSLERHSRFSSFCECNISFFGFVVGFRKYCSIKTGFLVKKKINKAGLCHCIGKMYVWVCVCVWRAAVSWNAKVFLVSDFWPQVPWLTSTPWPVLIHTLLVEIRQSEDDKVHSQPNVSTFSIYLLCVETVNIYFSS